MEREKAWRISTELGYDSGMEAHYNGIGIIVQAYKLQDHDAWSANFTLIEHRGSETIERPYHPMAAFPDRETAIKEALDMARREIDKDS